MRNGDGQPVHGEVSAGDTTIWLHRATAEDNADSPRAGNEWNSGLCLHVDNVDEHWEHARAAGAQIDTKPTDQPYGQREYQVRDPEGHLWWFATPDLPRLFQPVITEDFRVSANSFGVR